MKPATVKPAEFFVILLILSVFVAGQCRAQDAPYLQRIIWGEVTDLVLPVNTEQIITIDPPQDLEVGLPGDLAEKVDLLNAAGRIFITAKAAFERRKLIFKSSLHGAAVVYLSALEGTVGGRYVLSLPVTKKPAAHNQAEVRCSDHYADLARWGMQQLYAPDRLLSESGCFARVATLKNKAIDLFVCGHTMTCGGGLRAIPLASWQTAGNRWLHALLIKNTMQTQVLLDPRDFYYNRGLLAVAFAHPWLDKAGSAKDHTAAVLITADRLETVIPASRWLPLHRESR